MVNRLNTWFRLSIILTTLLFFNIIITDTFCISDEDTDFLSHNLPSTPVLLQPINNATLLTSRPTFMWSNVVNASNYTLQLDRASNFSTISIIIIEGLTTTNYTPEEALQIGDWFWRVKAINDSGSSPYSESKNLYILPEREEPPSISLNEFILVSSLILITLVLLVVIIKRYVI